MKHGYLTACVRAVLACSLLLGAWAQAQDASAAQPEETFSLREHYTKYEYRIPMRDGVKLFTVVYLPKDNSRSYPFLMTRTPYGVGGHHQGALQYGVDFFPGHIGPSQALEQSGYIFVWQDVRGRYMSEGVWQEMTPHLNPHRKPGEGNESQDMYDTVEWLLKHVPQHNGRVGLWGISYPGFYTLASIIDGHPAIKAASPQAPVTDLYMGDDAYHGGAFMLAANFDFYASFTTQENPTQQPKTWAGFEYGKEDGYAFFLQQRTLGNIMGLLGEKQRALLTPAITHTQYDAFWTSRNIAAHLKHIHTPVLTVGGWFDAEDLQGPLTTFQRIAQFNPGLPNFLVMGPWAHGGWAGAEGRSLGHVQFDSATAETFRTTIEAPFFEHYLKDAPAAPLATATVFETGSNRWQHFSSWPPAAARPASLYLSAEGAVQWQEPQQAGTRTYLADPQHPVPFVGYPTRDVPREYMVSDQRFAATRPDVLVFQSPPLEEDVRLAGPIHPHLFVSTTGTDADWVIKLIDVYPDIYPDAPPAPMRGHDVPPPGLTLSGYQQLVRGEPLRGKFRTGFDQPTPFTPGKMEELRMNMPDIFHTFRRGHRIMVQLQSSWFPLIDLNPQRFLDIPAAQPDAFQAAQHTVFFGPGHPTRLDVLLLP